MIRQGDVLVRRVRDDDRDITKMAPVAAEAGRVVLAHGEVTGHHHSFAMSSRVALFREDGSGSGLFLSITGASALLEHQEHTALPVQPGLHEVVRQRLFTSGMAQRVAD